MSNYTKTTNFAAKDSLPSGNAGKIVKGTEIDAEFNNIATASATKADINDVTLTGTTTFGSLNDGTITITGWVDEDNMSSNSAVLIPTQQSVKAYVDTNVTAQDLDVTDGSASIDIDLDSESLGILGGTGVTSTASGTGVTLAIDSTVATLTGSQTLTNKTLTTPTILTSFTIGSATISEAELEILDGATVTTAELNVLDGITSTTAELNILDGVTSTAAEINILDGVTSTTAELNILDGVTATAAEINILTGYTGTTADLNTLDGVTASAAELNILDGATVTTAEVNILDGVTSTAAELNILDGVTSTATELNILDGVTATTAELNILDGVTSTAAELNILDGVTSTTAELNILDGVTSTATELNLLDGVTATTAELNYTDGVTSAIQTQLDSKISGADAALTGNATITTSDNTTQLALISTDADASAGPILDIFRNSVSAADNDLTGQVYFSGNNDADEKTYYGQITTQITDVSNGSEDFALELSTLTAGASNSRLFISPTETVFNESSADLDFRIESDGNTNAFFLEGSSGNTGIGIAPSYKLTVNSGATTETTAAAFGYNGDAGTNLYVNTDHGNNLVSLYASGNASKAMRFLSGTLEVMRLDTSGNVGIGNAGTFNGAGTRKVQIEIANSSALGPELLIHNSGQGSGALAAITFGGKRSGNEGYTASIHTTNNDGLHFGTAAATDFSALPTTRMVIDTSGNVGIGTSSTYNMRATIAGAGAAVSTGSGSYAVASIYDTATAAAGTGGGLAFQGDDGTNSAVTFATVNGSKENATGGNYASYLGFSTRANGGHLTEKMRIDSAGRVTTPLQPAFLAQPAALQSNIPISTNTTVAFGTERFDQGSNFASNTFTAPVTGKYQLNVDIYAQSVDSAAAYVQVALRTSNRQYYYIFSTVTLAGDAAYMSFPISVLADMDASDTAYVEIQLNNTGAAQMDINPVSTFSGYLVA